jgi:DNA-binding NarL/FixJ family response regulator
VTPTPSCRVAVVEDSEDLRSLIATLLELEEDFELVGEAADGEEALAVIAAVNPDLLLLDMALPGMDGLEVLEHLGGNDAPRVVVYSGYSAPELVQSARDLGAVDYVVKGGPPDELIARLRAACAA